MKQAAATPPTTCPGCGTTPLEQPVGAGRRRLWCSEACRKREERKQDAVKRRLVDAVVRAYVDAQWKPKRAP